MTQLVFGQPAGGIFQFAYTVPDVQEAIHGYLAALKVGPWFVRGPFKPPAGLYRGEPTELVVTLARAFDGQVMIELVQQHNDVPSVYHPQGAPRRYGFHHFARLTPTMDADIEGYRALGYDEVYSDRLPSGARIVYVDSTPQLPGMIELIELTDAQARSYARLYQAALGWDGTDPVREG
jgi:hypothetical protein